MGAWVWTAAAGYAQTQTPPTPTVRQEAAEPAKLPGYNILYCSGFIAERPIEPGLFVVAGEDQGTVNQFAAGDMVYLSRGAGSIVNPSGEYMLLRKVKDLVKQDSFPGQQRLLETLGSMYQEVGRVRVNIVHEMSATARVLQSCDAIVPGDIAIPFNVKPAPPLKPSAGFDRFAPPTGKTGGLVVSSKDFMTIIGTGDIVYLDIGAKQGVAVGQYYRAFRPFEAVSHDIVRRYAQNAPEKIMSQRLGIRLTLAEQMGLPREVLGEMVIIHVEGNSATALVNFAQKEIYAGDHVELE